MGFLEELRPSSPLFERAIVCVSVNFLGGLIFGYNTGIIAGALGPMGDSFSDFNTVKQGIVTTSILLGALIGSAYGSIISDAIGKRWTTVILGIFTIVGAVLIAVVPWLWLLILCRELLGVGVGLASVVCGTFCAEHSPPSLRGPINAMFQVAITFGILLSYLMGYAFTNVDEGYRYMLGLGAIPGVLILIVTPFMKLAPLPIDGEQIETLMARKDEEQEGGLLGVYGRMFTQARRAVMLGFVLATSLQLTGINAIMYYGPTIFQNAGFDSPNISLIATISIGAWNFVSTFIALVLVNKLGRRILVLVGLGVITLVCFSIAFVFQFAENTTGGVISIILLFIYIAAFEASIGSLFWVVMTEVFPPEFEAAGASVMNVVQWTFNIILSASFPALVAAVGQSVMFWLFSFVGVLCFAYLFFYLPETKNLKQREETYRD